MKVSYNFVSLVALGNFNPAIVSPEFLNNVCDLGLGEPIESSPKEMPVFRSYKFPDLQITVELMRFNIQAFGLHNVRDAEVIKIFRMYYEKLPYTPLGAVGVNINCELIPGGEAEIQLLEEKLQDTNTYFEFLGVHELEVNEKSAYTDTQKKIWKGSDFVITNVNKLTRRINVKKAKSDSLTLNYNYEAGKLKRDMEELDLLFNGYDQFCEEFSKFVEYLEG